MNYLLTPELRPAEKNSIVLASGGVYPELARSVAASLDVGLAEVELKRHGNDELYARFIDSVRGKDVYVIQSHATNNGYVLEEALNEHYYLISAAVGASAKSVTAVAPYLGHSRGDRKSRGREVAPVKEVIKFFEAVGTKMMLSVDLHAPQTAENFRTGPYEHLTAQPDLRRAVRDYLGKESLKNCIVVAPDANAVKRNNRHAEELSKDDDLDIEVIFMGKERAKEDSTLLKRVRDVRGVEGKVCLTFDDMIDGGGTVSTAAQILKNSGAKEVHVAATHGIFSGEAVQRLMSSSIDTVFVTDTVPVDKAKAMMGEKLQVVRVGPLIGRAIYEIVTGGSISKIFADQHRI